MEGIKPSTHGYYYLVRGLGIEPSSQPLQGCAEITRLAHHTKTYFISSTCISQTKYYYEKLYENYRILQVR